MTSAPRRPRSRILLAVVAIVAAGAGGYGVRHLLEQRSAVVAARAPTPAPPTTPRKVRPAIPDVLPDIAFPDRGGTLRHFSHWKGRPLLVNFWAPWCGPCREETPLLERLSRAPADGLEVIGVAVASRPAVLRYARHAGIRYPLLIGIHPGLKTIRALGMEAAFPFSVFVDAAGRIVTFKIGVLREAEARLILGRIDRLDHGGIDMQTARSEIAAGIRNLAVARARAGSGRSL